MTSWSLWMFVCHRHLRAQDLRLDSGDRHVLVWYPASRSTTCPGIASFLPNPKIVASTAADCSQIAVPLLPLAHTCGYGVLLLVAGKILESEVDA